MRPCQLRPAEIDLSQGLRLRPACADAGHKAQPSDGQWRGMDRPRLHRSKLGPRGQRNTGSREHRAVHRAGKMVLLEIAQQPIAER